SATSCARRKTRSPRRWTGRCCASPPNSRSRPPWTRPSPTPTGPWPAATPSRCSAAWPRCARRWARASPRSWGPPRPRPCADTDGALARGDYVAVLGGLAALRPEVDAFFDAVMVNAEDPDLRRNRLALLKRLSARLGSVAAIEHLSA